MCLRLSLSLPPSRRQIVSFLVLLLFVSMVLFLGTEHRFQNQQQSPSESRIKTILLWNAPDRKELSTFGRGQHPFIQQECEFNGCEIVAGPWQRPLEIYDAVIIDVNDFYWLKELPPPLMRRPEQRYIFLTQESPAALKDYDPSVFMEHFNWTMTYRHDADIQLLYGRVRPMENAPKSQERIQAEIKATHKWKPKFSNKTKLVAGMISHCPTHGRREDYIVNLRRHITVDLYGECGQMSCPYNASCYETLESTYKFFLSFENAVCADYVTEKFFDPLSRYIVPIVYGGANYSQIAPPHSYIDARQFTPKQLADYLLKLDADDRLYNEYFWWKKHFTVESGLEQMTRHGFCDLCKKLHQDHELKSYSNLVYQWHVDAQCVHIPEATPVKV